MATGARVAVLAATAALTIGPGLALPLAARAASGSHTSSAAQAASGSPSSSAAQAALPSTSSALGGGITDPGVTPTTTATTPTVVNTTTTGGGGISTGSAIGIAIAAFVIIVGIAGAIFRDARRRTRGDRTPRADAERVPGSRRPPKARKLSPAERRRRKRGRTPRRR